jgi:hypothetical protein
MASHEFDEAHAIRRGNFVMDVATNIVRRPDGNLVRLTQQQALVFTVHNPPDISLPCKEFAKRVTSVLIELGEKVPPMSVVRFQSTKQYIKREKLPGWPK